MGFKDENSVRTLKFATQIYQAGSLVSICWVVLTFILCCFTFLFAFVCFVDIYFKELGGIISISPILLPEAVITCHPVVGRLQWFFFRFRSWHVPPFFALLWKIKTIYEQRATFALCLFCHFHSQSSTGPTFFPTHSQDETMFIL